MVEYRDDRRQKVKIEIEHEDGFIERFEARYDKGGNHWKTKLDHNGQKSWEQTHYGRDIDVAFQGLNTLVNNHGLARQSRLGNDKGRMVRDMNIAVQPNSNDAPISPSRTSRALYGE